MSWLGIGALALGAIVVGVIGQLMGDVKTNLEWLPDTVSGFIGAFLGSELLQYGPAWEGGYLVPAIVVGLLAAVLVDVVVRMSTGGSLIHRHGAPTA